MNAQDFLSLQEAYNQVHQVDEAVKGQDTDLRRLASSERQTEKAAHSKWKNTKPGVAKTPKFSSVPHTKNTGKEYANQQSAQISWHDKRTKGKFIPGMTSNEEVDIYDIILSHLLDEGYAETPEAAEVIMVNMSEDWRDDIMEGMTMKDFKSNRKKLRAREYSSDAKKRGHVGKEWYNSGERYSPDQAKRMRSKLDDAERRTRHRSAVDPDNEDDNNYSADKTKNPKKLRKQKAMGEHG